jgi:hypothetical protein
MLDQPKISPPPLEYLGPVQPVALPPARDERTFKLAIVCWLLPLSFGIVTFLLWIFFRWDFLEMVGEWEIGVGTLLAILGGISALVLISSRWSRSGRQFREAVLPGLLLLFLLASNFVVALLLIITVVSEMDFHKGP